MADLTTLAKVKLNLGITDTTNDTLISSLIRSVSAQVEAFCGRNFGTATYTKILDTKGEDRIFLKNYPVQSLNSVQYATGQWSALVYKAFGVNDYLLDAEEGVINFAYCLACAKQYLKISYTAGYLIDFANETDPTKHTLPFDLTQIVTEMVSSTYSTKDSSASGVTSMSTEGQSITYGSNSGKFTSDQQSRLSSYINYNI